MKRNVILDTGPLVALINRRDGHHKWAAIHWRDIEPPFFSCESVISESCFLLSQTKTGPRIVFEMLSRNVIDVSFRLEDHKSAIGFLLQKYSRVCSNGNTDAGGLH